MNFYQMHIGDFNGATRHLTFVERALYRELIDLYYDTERPLTADLAKLARRVVANTDELRAALEIVLEEFFTLQEDGWHNERCDREIAAYRQKAEQQSRAGRMSAAKRGQRGPRGCGAVSVEAGESDASSQPVERSFNDRSTTVQPTKNQEPRTKNHICSSNNRHGDDAAVPASHGEWMQVFEESFGVEVDPSNLQQRQKFVPLAKGWIAAGVTVGQMRDAVAKARSESKEGIAYLPSYVDRVLASMSAGAAVVAAAQAGESFATKDYGTKVVVL